MEQDKKWLSTIIDSALGAMPVVGAAAQNAFVTWRNKNISIAREVLLSNIRAGDVSAIHQDELFSMLARLTRSVQEGKAKSNLTLLARLITGIGRAEKENAKAETFNQYADMLESLTWAEIVFLSRCIKTGVVINGTSEIKQMLQQKGFFVYKLDPRMFNKKAQDFSEYNSSLDFAIQKWRMPTPYSPYNIPMGSTVDIYGNPILHGNDTKIPYGVDIDIQYEFSSKFNEFLQKYGNLWEDLSTDSKQRCSNNVV